MTDIAVVNGAAGALGRAVVRALVARGNHVVAVTRDGRRADLGTDGVRVEAADLTAPDQVEALWRRLDESGDRPRWVVNAAGGYRPGSVADRPRRLPLRARPQPGHCLVVLPGCRNTAASRWRDCQRSLAIRAGRRRRFRGLHRRGEAWSGSRPSWPPNSPGEASGSTQSCRRSWTRRPTGHHVSRGDANGGADR